MEEVEDLSYRNFRQLVTVELLVWMLWGFAFPLFRIGGDLAFGSLTMIPIVFLVPGILQAAQFSWRPVRWMPFIAINVLLMLLTGSVFWPHTY